MEPRPEALSGDIEGIIEMTNLADSHRKKLKFRPEHFFNSMYPTADIGRVIADLDQRFEGDAVPLGLFP